jgi:hypothetical protein
MPPTLHQPLQRALIAFAEGRAVAARRELASEPRDLAAPTGHFELPTRERVRILADGDDMEVERGGLRYGAYPVGAAVRYVPGLDLYLTGTSSGALRWVGLYEDFIVPPKGSGGR